MVTWDETKRRSNLAKHGVDLADAERFDFENALYEEDWDRQGEDRFRAVGSIDGRPYFLVYTVRDDQAHAISLRLADKKEKRRYFKTLSAPHRR